MFPTARPRRGPERPQYVPGPRMEALAWEPPSGTRNRTCSGGPCVHGRRARARGHAPAAVIDPSLPGSIPGREWGADGPGRGHGRVALPATAA
eukprot:238238-Chlamydomonas_euryale.AAC.2